MDNIDLTKSVEAKYNVYNIKASSIFSLVIPIIASVLISFASANGFFVLEMIIAPIILEIYFLIAAFYYSNRYKKIIKYNNYQYFDVKFTTSYRSHIPFNWWHVRFEVNVMINNEYRCYYTRAIFSMKFRNPLYPFKFDDYVDRMVLIGYNQKSNEIIVIKGVRA